MAERPNLLLFLMIPPLAAPPGVGALAPGEAKRLKSFLF